MIFFVSSYQLSLSTESYEMQHGGKKTPHGKTCFRLQSMLCTVVSQAGKSITEVQDGYRKYKLH